MSSWRAEIRGPEVGYVGGGRKYRPCELNDLGFCLREGRIESSGQSGVPMDPAYSRAVEQRSWSQFHRFLTLLCCSPRLMLLGSGRAQTGDAGGTDEREEGRRRRSEGGSIRRMREGMIMMMMRRGRDGADGWMECCSTGAPNLCSVGIIGGICCSIQSPHIRVRRSPSVALVYSSDQVSVE